MGNLFKKNLEVEGIIQKYLLPLLFVISLVWAGPRAEKIGNIISIEVLTENKRTMRVVGGPPKSIYVYQAIFDHSDNIWVFWLEPIGRWYINRDTKESIPPLTDGVFGKKVSINGNEIIPRKQFNKLNQIQGGEFPHYIFIGADNSLYLIQEKDIMRFDSLGIWKATSVKLGKSIYLPYILIDTISNKIFFHHSDNFGRTMLHTLDIKTLMILDTLILSEGLYPGAMFKGDGRTPLPPNIKWNYRHHKDKWGRYEFYQNKYIGTDWFNSNIIVNIGARNLKEGFVQKIAINNLKIIDSFSFEIDKNMLKRYKQVSLPKVQIVKGNDNYLVYIPLRDNEREWVSVFKFDSLFNLIIPNKTIEEKTKDFDIAPRFLPKQVLVKELGERFGFDKEWELEIDFFSFDIDGNLYYYQYQEKKQFK